MNKLKWPWIFFDLRSVLMTTPLILLEFGHCFGRLDGHTIFISGAAVIMDQCEAVVAMDQSGSVAGMDLSGAKVAMDLSGAKVAMDLSGAVVAMDQSCSVVGMDQPGAVVVLVLVVIDQSGQWLSWTNLGPWCSWTCLWPWWRLST